ncbi:glycosyltransferase [Muribaculaceae bacterium Isolate-042 (Harlan)]|uniref:Glycosyltransferase n=1 Tax=Muribaculum intestinale TaxID=1796646 RepID=A0A4S2G1A9_9BACT|nr:glycosyltransferase family 2 protein [Muribaculum intestinale]MCX4369020.1 glycosyltransferase family 2 protein [Duncaniella sp.]MYM12092.1 glycosyltransferase [Muribaculum intestinale]ROS79981.1 glycosyltransferase [Muribaculaceae bacterium Isolate-042 (Harlan)]TGY75664.1 glycosyltransferase [Muribaculum intestinale]
MAPLFSIITVTYNAADTLPATLASVKEQTCGMYEYIVMDGVSTDRTLKLAIDAGIPRARIYSSPDKGLYDAMNKAMALATGQYLIFLNSGDAFHSPDTLEHLARLITDNDFPGIVYGQTCVVDSSRRYLAPRHLAAPEELTLDSFADGMVVCHQAFVVLRKIAQPYNLKYRFSADYEWCIRCLQRSRSNVALPDNEVMIDYLSEGMTTRNRRASLIERFRIMSYYYGFFPTLMRHIGFVGRFLRRRRLEKSLPTG